MNILYCGDAGTKDGVLISILSILKHNTDQPINFYVMTIRYEGVEPFAQHTAAALDKIVKRTNPRNSVRLIDATDVFLRELPAKNMGSYFTPCSMLRLYADEVPELSNLDRLLYLDYDVVCRGSLAELYSTNLTGIEAAGVLDIYGRWFYHYHGLFRQDYMNSGVMLFNMNECRRSGMLGRARALCMRRWMMLADQAALNKAISHRKLMPRRFNEQGERPRQDTILHHFSNNFKFWPVFHVQKVKPFEVAKVHKVLKIHEYDDILREYNKLKGEL